MVLLVEDRDADGGHQAVAGELVLPRLGSLQRCEGGVGEGEREREKFELVKSSLLLFSVAQS